MFITLAMMKTRVKLLSIAHISLLVFGAAIFLFGCFQNSLWFDEAYTVGMMSRPLLKGMWHATFDVHPHLYYFCLKLFTLVFGNSLWVMRIFSAIGAILFASLGFTHIKKDFGGEVGFWFSFCAIFCASTLYYALQIRMYTYAAYFVTLAAIYAFRCCGEEARKKDRVLFLVFSICSAYTHHFALFAVCGINIVMLLWAIKNKKPLKLWWKNAAVQIGIYLPGAAVFILQALQGGGTWITIQWPSLVFDFVSYHIFGNTVGGVAEFPNPAYYIAGGICLLFYIGGAVFLRYYYLKGSNEKIKNALGFASKVYFGVVIFALGFSLFRTIYYIRYTVVICGLLFLMMAFVFACVRSKTVKSVLAVMLVLVFAWRAYDIFTVAYHPSAEYISQMAEEKIEEDDALLFNGIDGFVVAVQIPENQSYYYNVNQWDIHNAYGAFGDNVHIVDAPEDAKLPSRVWVLGRGDCYNYLREQGYTEIDGKAISTEYYHYYFDLILMELK